MLGLRQNGNCSILVGSKQSEKLIKGETDNDRDKTLIL